MKVGLCLYRMRNMFLLSIFNCWREKERKKEKRKRERGEKKTGIEVRETQRENKRENIHVFLIISSSYALADRRPSNMEQ